jgi:hypothetical protein
VEVLLGTIRLGFFDAELWGKGKSADDDNVAVKAGSNVPVKFSIENDAVCLALDPSFVQGEETCATATLAEGETLALREDSKDIAIVSVDDAGGRTVTLNMELCTDLRERSSIEEGRVDIPTFGDCVEVTNLEDFVVVGRATLCDAFDEAIDADLTPEQAGRMTVHRFGESDPATVALPHADAEACEEQALLRMNRMERLARLLRNTLHAARDHVAAWVTPQPLLATVAMCHRGGCGGSSDFESSFQTARPSQMNYGPASPSDGDFGTQPEGTALTAQVVVSDIGGDMVADARVSATQTSDDGTVDLGSFTTLDDGLAEFNFTVGPGANVVQVTGACIGAHPDAGGSGPFSPDPDDAGADPVTCETGVLTFTAFGGFPDPVLEFTGTEDYMVGEEWFTRYDLSVTNWSSYPDWLFEPSPDLPPCGLNENASRTWVHIYNGDDERLYGFCALDSSDDLQSLWFALPLGTTPPAVVYIEMHDRALDVTYRSNEVAIPAPEPEP